MKHFLIIALLGLSACMSAQERAALDESRAAAKAWIETTYPDPAVREAIKFVTVSTTYRDGMFIPFTAPSPILSDSQTFDSVVVSFRPTLATSDEIAKGLRGFCRKMGRPARIQIPASENGTEGQSEFEGVFVTCRLTTPTRNIENGLVKVW